MTFRFRPFQRTLGQLECSDLAILRTIAEGWYVEYKQDLRDIKALAKAISAFANTYGGWLFIGINEATDGTKTAGSFSGIPASDVPLIEERLREAASAHVYPAPCFEHRVFKGPCQDLGLKAGRAIIGVEIPPGHNPPYIHSSGKIYRRIADQSDPKPETDRSRLDLLWERNRRHRDRLASLLTNLPRRSKEESENSYIHLFLMADPLGDRGYRSRISFEEFSALMADGSLESGGLPFDNAFTSTEYFVARQVANNIPNRLLFTWRYSVECSSIITIPLSASQIDCSFASHTRQFLEGYKNADKFINECATQNIRSGWLVDLCMLYQVLAGIARKHRLLTSKDGLHGPFYCKAHIENVWRRIPFIDMSSFVAFVEKHGIPVIQDENFLAPPGTEPNCFLLLDCHDLGEKDDLSLHFLDAARMLAVIAESMGLPITALGITCKEDIPSAVSELLKMNERAMQVQKNRAGI